MHDTLCVDSSLLYAFYLTNSMTFSQGIFMTVCVYVFAYLIYISCSSCSWVFTHTFVNKILMLCMHLHFLYSYMNFLYQLIEYH
jgi:hypothetical protein